MLVFQSYLWHVDLSIDRIDVTEAIAGGVASLEPRVCASDTEDVSNLSVRQPIKPGE